jgi:hypothetical protein
MLHCLSLHNIHPPPWLLWDLHIVTRIPTARQGFGKHTPMEANARNNRAFTARQRISKHASLTTEAVFSAWPMQSGYKEVFSSMKQHNRVSCCQELGRVLVQGDWEEMAMNELRGERKTSCAIWSYSETGITSAWKSAARRTLVQV